MAFDPDQFLQSTAPTSAPPADSGGAFDPDAFLASTAAKPGIAARIVGAVKQAAPTIAAKAPSYLSNPFAAGASDAAQWVANNPKQAYDRFGRVLPFAGAIVGSVAGPGGAAVGAGTGEIARQAAGVYFQDPKVMSMITPGSNFSPQAGASAALQTGLSGLNEVNGLVKAAPGAAPYASRAVDYLASKLAPVGKGIVNAGAGTMQALTGKSAAKFRMLWNDPTVALPEAVGGAKSVEAAGQGMEDAFKTTGIQPKIFNPFEGDDQASQIASQTYQKWQAGQAGAAAPAELPVIDLAKAKASEQPVALFAGNQDYGNGNVKALYTVYQKDQALGMRPTLPGDQLPQGVQIVGREPRVPPGTIPAGQPVAAPQPISAQEAYNAKRATDYVFPKIISERNREKIAQMTQFKNAMDDVLSQQAGPLQQASQAYSRARLGADFRQILPRTKTGDVSTVKTVLAGLMADKARLPLLPLTSPAIMGGVTSAASLGSRAAGYAVSNPTARQALISAVLTDTSQGTGGTNEYGQ